MKYFLIISVLFIGACGDRQLVSRATAVADERSTLGLVALPIAANKQRYRLVICVKATGECRDALQTKDGREVTFVHDMRAQHLISNSDTGAVVALKQLPQAREKTAKRGKHRKLTVVASLLIVGAATSILLTLTRLKMKKPPERWILTNKTPGKEELVKDPNRYVSDELYRHEYRDRHVSFAVNGVLGAAAVAGIVLLPLNRYLWGYGERQAAEHWDSIFSDAEHNNAITIRDVDGVVRALAATFDFVVRDG